MFKSKEIIRQTEHLSPEAHLDIAKFAERGYRQIAKRTRTPRRTAHLWACSGNTDLLIKNLANRGYEPSEIMKTWPAVHWYLSLPSELSEEPVLVDPTWQQFLEGDARLDVKPEKPKVLIGTPEEIALSALGHGFRGDLIEIYRSN